MTAPVTFELKEETISALDAYAARIDRPRNALVDEALEEWLALKQWQVEEIEAGIADADAGRFASDEEVAAIFAKYGASYGPDR
jgi:predicted transcriptional regulator